MAVLAAFIVSKKVKLVQKKAVLVGSGLLQWYVA